MPHHSSNQVSVPGVPDVPDVPGVPNVPPGVPSVSDVPATTMLHALDNIVFLISSMYICQRP